MLALVCPICRNPLHPDSLTCEQSHAFHRQDGVLRLLTPPFAAQLDAFTQAFQADRIAQQYSGLPQAAYAQLPFGNAVRNDPEWRARQADLRLILKRLPTGKTLRVLDIGAWNGWLSHQLAIRGHDVTAVSYFADAQDGLGARQFYPNPKWQAIQMDECDLDVLRDEFDVVILNRCVQFSPDVIKQVQAAQARVAAGGLLIATGLNFFKDSSQHTARIQARAVAFRQRHGIDLFLRPTRGYLDWDDLTRLRALKLDLQPVRSLWRAWLKSLVLPASPRPCFGLWRR